MFGGPSQVQGGTLQEGEVFKGSFPENLQCWVEGKYRTALHRALGKVSLSGTGQLKTHGIAGFTVTLSSLFPWGQQSLPHSDFPLWLFSQILLALGRAGSCHSDFVPPYRSLWTGEGRPLQL